MRGGRGEVLGVTEARGGRGRRGLCVLEGGWGRRKGEWGGATEGQAGESQEPSCPPPF